MNILIIGSGAIGIALGASLLSQGAEISFYATNQTAQLLTNGGVERIGIFKNIKHTPDEFMVYTSYDELPTDTFEFILISSKTNQNNEISQKLNEHRNIMKEDCKIIIFQNGFGNDEYYLRYFRSDQVFCARVITGFIRPVGNISKITVHTAPILLGSLQNEDVSDLKIIANMINNSGIPSDITDEVDKYLWAKMIYNCALNPLSAILEVKYGKLSENQYTINIMNNIIEEIFKVIDKSGYSTFWSDADAYKEEFYSKLIIDTYNHESSMLQDFRKNQKSEIDSLTGYVIELADRYGVEVPTNRVIYNLIKARELFKG